jgi:hypothetical protein
MGAFCFYGVDFNVWVLPLAHCATVDLYLRVGGEGTGEEAHLQKKTQKRSDDLAPPRTKYAQGVLLIKQKEKKRGSEGEAATRS